MKTSVLQIRIDSKLKKAFKLQTVINDEDMSKILLKTIEEYVKRGNRLENVEK